MSTFAASQGGNGPVGSTGAAPDGAPVARREPRPWVRYASVRGGSTPIGDSASPKPRLVLEAVRTLRLMSATTMVTN